MRRFVVDRKVLNVFECLFIFMLFIQITVCLVFGVCFGFFLIRYFNNYSVHLSVLYLLMIVAPVSELVKTFEISKLKRPPLEMDWTNTNSTKSRGHMFYINHNGVAIP